MAVQVKPLAEITREAINVLYQELGVVNTVRFINQFTVGYGDYTEAREELFGDKTLDELVTEIKQARDENIGQ